MRDAILLTGPDVNSVPRQVKRVRLMENGHAISGFQLQKEWSECVVDIDILYLLRRLEKAARA